MHFKSMPDLQNGHESPADGQQPPVMPTAENKPTVIDQTDAPVPASTDSDLPADANERTREQFEKLKATNKELAEKLRLYEAQHTKPISVMDELFSQPPQSEAPADTVEQPATEETYEHLTQAQIDDVKQKLIDRDGYLDERALEHTLRANDAKAYAAIESAKKATEAARKAEERAKAAEERIAKFEQTQLTRELHKAYPQADPYSDSYDPVFYEHLKKELFYQLREGKTDPLKAAADVSNYYKPQAPADPRKEAVAKRQQATAQAGGKRGETPKYSEDELVRGTRHGDINALAERLRRAGF